MVDETKEENPVATDQFVAIYKLQPYSRVATNIAGNLRPMYQCKANESLT